MSPWFGSDPMQMLAGMLLISVSHA